MQRFGSDRTFGAMTRRFQGSIWSRHHVGTLASPLPVAVSTPQTLGCVLLECIRSLSVAELSLSRNQVDFCPANVSIIISRLWAAITGYSGLPSFKESSTSSAWKRVLGGGERVAHCGLCDYLGACLHITTNEWPVKWQREEINAIFTVSVRPSFVAWCGRSVAL